MNKLLSILLTATLLVSCATVPITGRRQVNLLNEQNLMSMSLTQYNGFLEQHNTVPDYDKRTKMVKNAGEKLKVACEQFLKSQGKSSRVKGFEWEFNLVEEETVNAWCMPGGKVVFYTGIMPICQDETGVAVVMSHEIAHAVARHGNERMSQQLLVQLGGATLSVAMNEKPGYTRDLFMLSYGLGSQLGSLAYSRAHESEADKMGLVFMEYAGYNSEAAVDFWKRMSEQGGQKPPELLSTHPSDEKRINDIREYIPVAKSYAKKK
jgi:predicted Zn-dependent protease